MSKIVRDLESFTPILKKDWRFYFIVILSPILFAFTEIYYKELKMQENFLSLFVLIIDLVLLAFLFGRLKGTYSKISKDTPWGILYGLFRLFLWYALILVMVMVPLVILKIDGKFLFESNIPDFPEILIAIFWDIIGSLFYYSVFAVIIGKGWIKGMFRKSFHLLNENFNFLILLSFLSVFQTFILRYMNSKIFPAAMIFVTIILLGPIINIIEIYLLSYLGKVAFETNSGTA